MNKGNDVKKDCVTITYSFGAYLVFTLLVWSEDIIDFIFSSVSVKQGTLISHMIAILLVILLIFIFRKKININRDNANLLSIIIIILLLLHGLVKGLFPDNAYDTIHYHILAQEPGFYNYFENNGFAIGSYQIWGFRLGDRLFYYSRILMGYRIGTILYSVVLVIIYLQLVNLLKKFFIKTNEYKFKKILNAEIFAGLIIISYEFLLAVGTYYVDIFAIPFMIELLRIAFFEKHLEKITLYVFFLQGFVVAFKLTNISFTFPYIVWFLWRIRHDVHFLLFINLSVLFLLPSSIYVLHTFLVTGNPIFPMYNSIFKSNLYLPVDINYADIGFGGVNVIEKIIWPAIYIFCPSYRQSEIPAENIQWMNVIGFVGWLFFTSKREGNSISYGCLSFITLSSSILWGLTSGYSRYNLIYIVLLGIWCWLFIRHVVNKYSSYTIPITVFVVLFYVISFFQCAININNNIEGREWSWRKITFEGIEEMIQEIQHSSTNQFDKEKIDILYISSPMCDGIASYIFPGVYNFNAVASSWIYNKSFVKKMYEINKERFHGGVYDVKTRYFEDMEQSAGQYNKEHFGVVSINTIKRDCGEFNIIELSQSDQAFCMNRIDDCIIVADYINGDNLEFILINQFMLPDEVNIVVYKGDSLEEKDIVYSENMHPYEHEKIIVHISYFVGEESFRVVIKNIDGTLFSGGCLKWLYIINTCNK